jgi:hypothetical protein
MYRHRQLHLWITDHDYYLLRDIAEERHETLSSVIRRLIKLHRPCPLLTEGAPQVSAEATEN